MVPHVLAYVALRGCFVLKARKLIAVSLVSQESAFFLPLDLGYEVKNDEKGKEYHYTYYQFDDKLSGAVEVDIRQGVDICTAHAYAGSPGYALKRYFTVHKNGIITLYECQE